MNNKLVVLSSYADDILMDVQGNVLEKRAGGPAYFISNVLDNQNIPFDLQTNEKFRVEIVIDVDNERGRTVSKFVPHRAEGLSRDDWVVVSTILREWDLSALAQIDNVFVDIQGYVRKENTLGDKAMWADMDKIADNVFCIKGTKEEMEYLPKDILEKQKNKLLVITKGGEGVDVYYKGQYQTIEINKINNLKNAIGAGDTFFANFVAAMFLGKEPFAAAQVAAQKTAIFLATKTRAVNSEITTGKRK